MKRFRLIVILALVLVMATVGMASAQSPAYQTPFTTSVTYQNVGTSNATIVFSFYPEMNASPITVNKTLAAGAGTSLYLGSIDTPACQLHRFGYPFFRCQHRRHPGADADFHHGEESPAVQWLLCRGHGRANRQCVEEQVQYYDSILCPEC